MINLGAGDLFLTPSGANATPVKVASLSEVNLDVSFDQKELYGSNIFPDFVARTNGKITGKAKHAHFQGGLIAAILSGSTTTAGMRIGVPSESTGTISGATYTAKTVTGFEDLGARNENGVALKKVAATPASGEYSVSSEGVYTFNAEATGKTYSISYSYTSASTGKTTAYTNQLVGTAPTFAASIYNTTPQGKKFGIKLFAVTLSKFALGMKRDDFTQPDIDFAAFADADGKVFDFFYEAD